MAKPNTAQQLQMIRGLDFPDYEFREFPKMVKSATQFDAKGAPLVVTVNSPEEERKATQVPREDKPEKEVLPEGHHAPAGSAHVDKPEGGINPNGPDNEAVATKTGVSMPGAAEGTVVTSAKPQTVQQAQKGEAERLAAAPGGVLPQK